MNECNYYSEHKDRFVRIEKDVKDATDRINEAIGRLVATEQSSRSAHHRLDTHDTQIEALKEISADMRYISQQILEIVESIKDHEERIDAVEKAPNKKIAGRWNAGIGAAIGAGAVIVVKAVAAFFGFPMP